MAWLSDWAKRYEITIDSDKVDEDLTDFPVFVPLYSGTGLVPFDPYDFFDELAILSSGTLFSEDFTASGTNWTHIAGTTSYTSGYWYTTTANTEDRTTNSFYFGEDFDITIGRFLSGRPNYATIYFCYDVASTNYPVAIQLVSTTPTVGVSNCVNVYTKAGPSAINVLTDTTYNIYNDNGSSYSIRARREGNKLKYKIWRYTANEPTNWFYEIDNAFSPGSHPTTGLIRIVNGTSNYTSIVDDITVRTHTPTTEKRIAITTFDGVTQCPVEVEWFDGYDKKAFLWTKLPTISSGTDTKFYLYYDKTKTDNVNYVGYTDSTPAEQIWDSNYLFVGHMNVTPNKGYLKDSTSNNVDSTAFSVDPADYLAPPLGTSYKFDNAALDKIDLGYNMSNPITTLSGAFTVETLFKFYNGNATYGRGLVAKGTDYNSGNKKSWALHAQGTGPFYLNFELSDTGVGNAAYNYSTAASYNLNEWYYMNARFTPGTKAELKVNDVVAVSNTSSVPSAVYVPTSSPNANDNCWIGAFYRFDTNPNYFDGEIAETRISNIIRSDAWLKASYHTLTNTFLTFEPYELAPSYYYQGYVKEKGTAAQRTVRLYLRDTGELMDEVVSASGTGYYYLTTSVSGEHFVVAFDDDTGDEYNALILDRLDPTGIA